MSTNSKLNAHLRKSSHQKPDADGLKALLRPDAPSVDVAAEPEVEEEIEEAVLKPTGFKPIPVSSNRGLGGELRYKVDNTAAGKRLRIIVPENVYRTVKNPKWWRLDIDEGSLRGRLSNLIANDVGAKKHTEESGKSLSFTWPYGEYAGRFFLETSSPSVLKNIETNSMGIEFDLPVRARVKKTAAS